MYIVLCGMMGAGKSTVGGALARLAQTTWLDTDALIEEKYGKITDIFAEHGEGYFRDLETETIKGLDGYEGLVLSVGGGLVLRKENVRLLKEKGVVVYLRATLSTLKDRLQKDDTRPLLKGDDGLEVRLKNLLSARGDVYEGVADYVVDVDGKSPETVAEEILSLMGKA